MQVSEVLPQSKAYQNQASQTQVFSASKYFYDKQYLFNWLCGILLFITTGIAISVFHQFQQLLLQVYAASWQMTLLFALIGLMIALMLGQHYLSQMKVKSTVHWSILSSITVAILSAGVIVCILATPSII